MISGTARGISLIAPKGTKTRPTGDRMKEDLFNILGPEVRNMLFLDLYCGSGAIGIEALSRGAETAVFVDSSLDAINATKSNLRKARLESDAEVLHMPVLNALENFDRKFDLIFMDPPYESKEPILVLEAVNNLGLLKEEGIIVVECSKDIQIPKGFTIYRQKKYTGKQFVFIRHFRCE